MSQSNRGTGLFLTCLDGDSRVPPSGYLGCLAALGTSWVPHWSSCVPELHEHVVNGISHSCQAAYLHSMNTSWTELPNYIQRHWTLCRRRSLLIAKASAHFYVFQRLSERINLPRRFSVITLISFPRTVRLVSYELYFFMITVVWLPATSVLAHHLGRWAR